MAAQSTPPNEQRPQIEEAKEYLRSSGFTDVADSPDQRDVFEKDLYRIVAIWRGAGFRILRISTIWMSDHPQPQPGEVRAGLERRSVADRLKQHAQVTVHDSGTTTEE
jgi:hypothetical protein